MQGYGNRQDMNNKVRNQAEAVVQRVYSAVESLSTGKGDVRDRLEMAIGILLPLPARDFPEHLRKDFEWVINESTKYESPYPECHGNITETMKRIRNSTESKIAERIFKIYSEIQNIRGFPLRDYRNPNA